MIRTARVEDAEKLLAIYAPYVTDTAISFEYEVPSVEEFENRIRLALDKYTYIVAEEDGEIIGYAYAGAFKTRVAYYKTIETSIYVKMGNRRSGVGRKLYAELEKRLSEKGIVNACAYITSSADKSDDKIDGVSRKFHESMGYKFVGEYEHVGYKFDKWYGLICMQKTIGEL